MTANPFRIETDSLGEVRVDASKYWGAQTQRSLAHFSIGKDIIPKEVITAYAIIKLASARSNNELGKLKTDKLTLIERASHEILEGKFDNQFPLHVWQTGSGTQTNMNLNEVIANRANEIAGTVLGAKSPIHPNNDVNMSQSSNDTFPAAMHISAYMAIQQNLLPVLKDLLGSFESKIKEISDVIKIGRTHLQDAVPITFGQEFSGYAAQIGNSIKSIDEISKKLLPLPIGGSAVGTGLNTHKEFARTVVKHINTLTSCEFFTAENKFCYMAAHDDFSLLSGALKTFACAMIKIANDIRWLASGPSCGIGEIIIPSNEPGSSIMPGKVNPTQCEAMTMVCAQVIGYDAAITFACSQGNFELNVYKPLIIYDVLESIRILADCCSSFTNYLVKGIEVNQKKVKYFIGKSYMLATALNEVIGYDNAAKIAKYAYHKDISLKEAALELNLISESDFDRVVDPSKMV
ncbi:MAG TPA: class II fumarate hydratase [Lentisphaeria bacterium]|nr:MAG: fumarate hydratase, class II [Lentisphaerae bacterium GWF2_38_69]HBM15017.1 class II fumarate hydratase [Lentisphaeria bacterium]